MSWWSDNFKLGDQEVKEFGQVMAVGAAATSVINAYFEAATEKIKIKGAAASKEQEADYANLEASSQRDMAVLADKAGNYKISLLSQASAAEQSDYLVNVSRRGVYATGGSSAEGRASMELAKQMDVQVIKTNTVREVGARMRQSVNSRNRAMFARVSAANLRDRAGSISPWAASLSAAMGAGASVASAYTNK